MWEKRLLLAMIILLSPSLTWALEIYHKDDISLQAGWWGQAWYQYVSNMDTDADGQFDDGLNDLLVRRSYFYLNGTVTPNLSFFLHYAGDKLGMDEITDDSGKGMGSGLALRDGWINYKLLNDDLMVQIGRMYIPFSRNYGTTSTKSLLTTDLDWGQGGMRSSIFYPSNIGRDDGVTLWGNVLQDKLQYRLMVSDGEEVSAKNPDDSMRYAGRLSYNFFDSETEWFNAGTYLGKKRVLALGIGADFQEDLMLAGAEQDYFGWTVDLHYDQPLGNGDNLTVAASFIDISNTANAITFTRLASGDDGSLASLKAGYFFGGKLGLGNLQPFAHYQVISVDERGKKSTDIYGVGANYYIKGAANKLTLEATVVDQDEEIDNTNVQDETLITFQVSAGF